MLALIVFLSFACGPKKVKTRGKSAEELYTEAVQELEKEEGGFLWIFGTTNYEKIFALLKEVRIRYTYSPYATLAELKTGDAYYKKEEYEQAAIEYEEFLKRHPGHEQSAYATYRLAKSHDKQIQSPDRDPTHTREALKWYTAFVNDFPDSPNVDNARKRIRKIKERLAKREMQIAQFYEDRQNYEAAAGRYNTVIENFSETRKYEEALYLLGKSYYEAGKMELAQETLERVVRGFPDTEYHDDAEELLQEIENDRRREAKK